MEKAIVRIDESPRHIAACREGRGFRVCVGTPFACHSEELPWAFGPPEGMKFPLSSSPRGTMACPYNGQRGDFQESADLTGVRRSDGPIPIGPRFARNDSPKEVLIQTLQPSHGKPSVIGG